MDTFLQQIPPPCFYAMLEIDIENLLILVKKTDFT